MKITCLQENLVRGLRTVGRAVSTRSTLPITQNVLLSTENSMLKIAATDLSIAITTSIGAKVEEEGSITIPARLLADLVNSLPPEVISIETTTKPIGITLKCDTFNSNINGTKGEDFPPVPNVEDGITAKIDPNVLRESINRVAFAAAVDDNRPVLTGVKVEITGDDFTFAAADGFRLAVNKGKLTAAPENNMEFLIPARALSEVGRLINGNSDTVEFLVSEKSNQALFKVGDVEMVTSLLAGNFPNYNQLIPAESNTKLIAATAEFLRAARTASLFARDSGIVRLHIEAPDDSAAGGLTLMASGEEVGDNVSKVRAVVKGKSEKIAFNAKYLTSVLDVMGDEVEFSMSTSSSPGVIRPKEGDYTHVIMPLFVQWT